MQIRRATENDAEALLKIYAPYVEHSTASWEYEAPSLAEFSGRLREHLDTGFPWLLAEEDGAVLGYAYAGRFAGATTGTPRSQYTCLPPHTGGTPPPRCTPHCWLCCAGRATSTALRSSHTPTRPAPPSTSGWALPKPRACPTRATRTAGGWVFPIISSRCSRFLPCPCRLCR